MMAAGLLLSLMLYGLSNGLEDHLKPKSNTLPPGPVDTCREMGMHGVFQCDKDFERGIFRTCYTYCDGVSGLKENVKLETVCNSLECVILFFRFTSATMDMMNIDAPILQ